MSDICVVCDEKPAVHTHHRKMRSQGGGDEPSNLLRVCAEDHAWIHANPSEAYARGLLVHSWADPANVRLFVATPDETPVIPIRDVEHPVGEGEVCPTCERRKPKKKKADSPTTRVWSTRVPVADADSFSELVDAAAEHHGLSGKSHHRFWTLNYALVLLLQAEKGDLPV